MDEVTKITVNGREYDSVEQMPPDVRKLYLLAMASMRNAGPQQASVTEKTSALSYSTGSGAYVYNGREYNTRDELPPEAQQLLEQLSKPLANSVTSEVKINTTRTFLPESRLADDSSDEPYRPPPETRPTYSPAEPYGRPERDPKIAWLLVNVLIGVIVVLLILFYLEHHKPWGK